MHARKQFLSARSASRDGNTPRLIQFLLSVSCPFCEDVQDAMELSRSFWHVPRLLCVLTTTWIDESKGE